MEKSEKKLRDIEIENGEIIGIEYLEEKSPELQGIRLGTVPERCCVRVKLRPTKESDILVELWMPLSGWNGNFLGTGNGGFAGRIDELALINGISRGYAVANTDLGSSLNPDDLIGKQERWKDFGYRATHLMTLVSKKLIKAFYFKEPRYAYFMGGSTGGQQALMEAQRYPEDYDGIIAIAPANNRVHLHTAFIWNWKALTEIEGKGISLEEADAITNQVLKYYAAASGSNAGEAFMSYPHKVSFDMQIFDELIKKKVLKAGQAEALKKIYRGPVDPVTGEQIFVPMVPGSENGNLGLAEQGKREKFAADFFYLFRWIFGKEFNPEEFDFHRDLKTASEKLSPVLDATETDISGFKQRGGKLLMLSGTADPIIPYTDAMNYYNRVIEEEHGIENTQKFFRYFLVPGLAHVFGGPGVQDIGMLGLDIFPKDKRHDVLAALAAWVEKGEAPDAIYPVAYKKGLFGRELDYEKKIHPYRGKAL